ncbi:hypothetical protein PR202_gb19873 [Eleusine coracana subsp. coracana]|uniref:Uncharacterized protein n=1 Tax=Eleusine coracana subsp. coracana TaxID=191504 RepID=A0AAV5FB50_ELECO|nr:hypothetical protein PR202_gb19873 [Eleusine coracana subsp. coracana]
MPTPAEEPTPPEELLRLFRSPNSRTRLGLAGSGVEAGPSVISFTSPTAISNSMPSSSTVPIDGVEPFTITFSVSAPGATVDNDEPREIHTVEPPPQPPTQSPRRGARMRVGGRGRPSGRLAPRTVEQSLSMPPRSPEFTVLTRAETAGTSTQGSSGAGPSTSASPHTPNGDPLLRHHSHLAGTPPRHPGREADTWAATARIETHLNGVLHEEDLASR